MSYIIISNTTVIVSITILYYNFCSSVYIYKSTTSLTGCDEPNKLGYIWMIARDGHPLGHNLSTVWKHVAHDFHKMRYVAHYLGYVW